MDTINNKYDNGKDFLMYTKVTDIVLQRDLLHVTNSDSAFEAFKKIRDNKILSLPIWEKRHHRHTKFIDIADIACYVMAKGSDQSWTSLLQGATCKQISDTSTRNVFSPIDHSAPIVVAIESLAADKLHRLPIIDADGELQTMLSQSRITDVIYQNLHLFSFGSKTVGELKLGYCQVLSVKKSDKVLDGFKLLTEKHISGIAVVDDAGELTGNLSVSDLRRLHDCEVDNPFFCLNQTVEEFFNGVNASRPPVFVNSTDTIKTVFKSICDHKIHRVFVKDNDKLAGVIVLSDLLGLALAEAKLPITN